jgi:hypothetical protein
MLALSCRASDGRSPLLHLALSKVPRTPLRLVHILLLYALVLGVGVIGLPMGFIPHVFFPDQRRNRSAGRREARSSSRLVCMTAPGAF